MADAILTVFVDTNCFIHLKDIKDLPWPEVFPDFTRFEIVVAPIVVDELDKLKVEREDRKRNRARQALRLIEVASNEHEHRSILRAKPFEITLRIALGKRIDWAQWSNLDQSRPDDQLVAAALTEEVSGRKTLLSFNTGPLLRARMCHLDAKKSPDNWHLPEQTDDSSRKIVELTRALELERTKIPRIEAAFVVSGTEVGQIELRIPILPPLPSHVRQALVTELQQRSPREVLQANTRMGLLSLYNGYTSESIESYHVSYTKFIEASEIHFQSLHEKIAAIFKFPEVKYHVSNIGTVTALNLLIEFRGPDNASVLGSFENVEKWSVSLKAPEPPEKPQTLFQYDARGLGHGILHDALSKTRALTDFYWQERPKVKQNFASAICGEFRPTREYEDSYWLYLTDELPFSGTVVLDVSATNLSAPVRAEAMLRLEQQPAQWLDDDVLNVLEDWVAECIRNTI